MAPRTWNSLRALAGGVHLTSCNIVRTVDVAGRSQKTSPVPRTTGCPQLHGRVRDVRQQPFGEELGSSGLHCRSSAERESRLRDTSALRVALYARPGMSLLTWRWQAKFTICEPVFLPLAVISSPACCQVPDKQGRRDGSFADFARAERRVFELRAVRRRRACSRVFDAALTSAKWVATFWRSPVGCGADGVPQLRAPRVRRGRRGTAQNRFASIRQRQRSLFDLAVCCFDSEVWYRVEARALSED